MKLKIDEEKVFGFFLVSGFKFQVSSGYSKSIMKLEVLWRKEMFFIFRRNISSVEK
jgi:hypothetical protein